MDLHEEREFEVLIHKIAIATLENGGAAVKIDTAEFLPHRDIWSFPKYPGRTAILPQGVNLADELRGFIVRNERFLSEPDCWLGTWIHPHTREFYFDISTGCADLGEAKEMAHQAGQRAGRKIVAIYNSKRGETVFL